MIHVQPHMRDVVAVRVACNLGREEYPRGWASRTYSIGVPGLLESFVFSCGRDRPESGVAVTIRRAS